MMGGMYPDDQIISMFGENVRWPGMDLSGKFTNGNFDDPEQKPSFIPAESINLILDNLSELIKAAGKTPNNTEINQLAEIWKLKANLANPVFTGTPKVPGKATDATSDDTLIATEAQVALKANLASPVFTGTPKVPGKATAATSDGTLIATEAQVALKANLASPVFTGTPSAPTAAANNNSTQIATAAYADNTARPVATYYTQYPAAASNDYATAFPAVERPANRFGGTWTMVWEDTNYAFWRSGGSLAADSGRSNGLQGDAIRNITGLHVSQYTSYGAAGETMQNSGAFVALAAALTSYVGSAAYYAWGGFSFDASRVVPVASENRPVNRRFIIWKRTA